MSRLVLKAFERFSGTSRHWTQILWNEYPCIFPELLPWRTQAVVCSLIIRFSGDLSHQKILTTFPHFLLNNIWKWNDVKETMAIPTCNSHLQLWTLGLGIIHLVRTQNFPKNYYFYPPLCTRMYAYQMVRNVDFSKNLTHLLHELFMTAFNLFHMNDKNTWTTCVFLSLPQAYIGFEDFFCCFKKRR